MLIDYQIMLKITSSCDIRRAQSSRSLSACDLVA